MMFTFLIIGVTEFMLVRSLSKLMSAKETQQHRSLPPPVTNDLRLPQALALSANRSQASLKTLLAHSNTRDASNKH